MSAPILEILLILLLLIANGVFSASEMAIVSSSKVRLEQMAKKGNLRAKIALKLAESPNNFLSTVQIGITLIGILSGAVGGATIAERLESFLGTIPHLYPYRNVLSIVIVVACVTYLSLVVGELVPKRIALHNPEELACRVSRPMKILSRWTAPLVHLLGLSTDTLLNIFGIKAKDEPSVTEEEIKGLIEKGTLEGTFEEAEQRMVSRVFRLGDRPIKGLMTPRVDIDWLDAAISPDENLRTILNSPHSRFPVCESSIDNCHGIIRVKSFLSAYLDNRDIDLKALAKQQTPLYVAEGTRALKVLEMFKESETHIALITDEYGGVEGLVTLNDLMEAIFGEIPSQDDQEEPMIIQRDDGSWLLDGLLPIDELKNLLKQESIPEDDTGKYHTLGGFTIALLGRIPMSSDHFEWNGWRFEVVDMDGTRVDKVLVMALPQDSLEEFEE